MIAIEDQMNAHRKGGPFYTIPDKCEHPVEWLHYVHT